MTLGYDFPLIRPLIFMRFFIPLCCTIISVMSPRGRNRSPLGGYISLRITPSSSRQPSCPWPTALFCPHQPPRTKPARRPPRKRRNQSGRTSKSVATPIVGRFLSKSAGQGCVPNGFDQFSCIEFRGVGKLAL